VAAGLRRSGAFAAELALMSMKPLGSTLTSPKDSKFGGVLNFSSSKSNLKTRALQGSRFGFSAWGAADECVRLSEFVRGKVSPTLRLQDLETRNLH